MELTQEFEKQIFSFIENLCGLSINEAHKNYMRSYIKKRLVELNMDMAKFCRFVQIDSSECASLLNEAAINETYFFREEQQFDFLKNTFFPKFSDKKITIWSAACSTGEEPISLYALATACGKEPTIYATDIDTVALKILSEGKYTKHSFRRDGSKYHNLLEKIGSKTENGYELSREVKAKIHKGNFNLISGTTPPLAKNSVDLLFLRNVFIYFSSETRRKVIRKIASYLSPGGYLFLSVNDIAGTDCDADVPLVKMHVGNIYYFKKVDMNTKAEMLKSVMKRTEPVRTTIHKPLQKTGNMTGTLTSQNRIATIASNRITATAPRRSISETSRRPAVTTPQQLKTNEALKNKVSVQHSDIENLAHNIFSDLDNKKILEAKKKIVDYKFRPENLEYKAYFNGLIAETENDDKNAVQQFSIANIYEPNFWPAYFKLGLIYEKKGNRKESKKVFSTCAKILENYINENNFHYNFLIEHFSPAYFLDVCKKYACE